MASLLTNKNQLVDINRQRDLANMLQQQALSFAPIQHPLQGFAKLAQALVANQLRNRAAGAEQGMAEQQAKALAEALDPSLVAGGTETSQAPEAITGPRQPMVGPTDHLGFPQRIQPPRPTRTRQLATLREPNTQERLAAIGRASPEAALGIAGNLMQQQMLAEAGLLPGQQRAPTAFEQKLQAVQLIDPDGSKGILGSFLTAGDIQMTHGNFLPAGGNQPFAAVRVNGIPYRILEEPVNGSLIGPPLSSNDGQFVSSALQSSKASDLTPSAMSKTLETVSGAMVALDQLERVELFVDVGGLTDDTFFGSMRKFFGNVSGTLNAIRETAGGRAGEIFIGGRWVSDAIAASALESGNVTLDANRIAEADFEKYGQEGVASNRRANQEFLRSWSRLDGRTQQLSISIAYTLARIADPGGRLSEMDVLNQMRALGLDSPSKERRLAALQEAKRTFALRVKSDLAVARAGGADIALPEGFEARIDSILEETALPSAPPPSASTTEIFDHVGRLGNDTEAIKQFIKTLPPDHPIFAENPSYLLIRDMP